VSLAEANARAQQWGVPYVETSAKTRDNVDKVRILSLIAYIVFLCHLYSILQIAATTNSFLQIKCKMSNHNTQLLGLYLHNILCTLLFWFEIHCVRAVR
jgi:hypothetical protein